MSQYRVTLEGDAREFYIVEAESPEDASERWDVDGWREGVVCSGMDVVSVELDEDDA